MYWPGFTCVCAPTSSTSILDGSASIRSMAVWAWWVVGMADYVSKDPDLYGLIGERENKDTGFTMFKTKKNTAVLFMMSHTKHVISVPTPAR